MLFYECKLEDKTKAVINMAKQTALSLNNQANKTAIKTVTVLERLGSLMAGQFE